MKKILIGIALVVTVSAGLLQVNSPAKNSQSSGNTAGSTEEKLELKDAHGLAVDRQDPFLDGPAGRALLPQRHVAGS